MKYFAVVVLVVAMLIMAACVPLPSAKATPTQSQIGLPNPASKYCVDKGGKLEIRDEAGGQAGYCIFPDGSECDEWAYFRGQCEPGASTSSANMVNPASKFCQDQGYKWEARDEAGGQVGYCLFPDGSECEEWAFYRGQCAPGGGTVSANMPNPASKYCVDQGGKLEIRDEAGGQAGYCVFPDGSECDEWAYFRGQCAPGGGTSRANMVNPASKFCTDQGYKWEARDEAGGEVGYCLFPDGSECEEWAFYRGQCAPGSK
jgi:putative hemolysin